MAKLFVLGFCLLCFLGGAVPGYSPRNAQKSRIVMCNYCKVFYYGVCLTGLKTCSVEKRSGCRSQVNYKKNGDGYEYTHTELDCFKDCKEKKFLSDKNPSWTLCCGENNCNLPYTYLKSG